MKSTLGILLVAASIVSCSRQFPLVKNGNAAAICIDENDAAVVSTAANLLSADMAMTTGTPLPVVETVSDLPDGPVILAGTVGQSSIIDNLMEKGLIDVSGIKGKWECYLLQGVSIPGHKGPALVIAGSDRRGTAYGLMSLSDVSPWYWWADIPVKTKKSVSVSGQRTVSREPDVQYRGIFINDERFGGWAKWVEQTFDKETHQVGPKVYEKVFELLLRLKANYLWPAMHNGSRAFNANPENAALADKYAIVMGSSHCELMLRNNEDEWKNAGTWGDFNYITNRDNMIRYWEERVQTNGKYENIYTLGLRGIHDYPMEGARTTEERRDLMQKAIDDQRDILARNIDKPLEEIPQVLCTYEEVLDAYHAGLRIPEDMTLLWSDDKQGYTRNLCNPEEQKRKGGAGIYYHISYHGDPASWLWLSPLSPAFISTELTKAYTYGARKIWIFNVGDIKPAEKELSFAMDLAWDISKWNPENAHKYIEEFTAGIFGKALAREIAPLQEEYYRLQASGKDSQVYFLEYSEKEILERIQRYRAISEKAFAIAGKVPQELWNPYFELFLYPIHGAGMLNEYQLLSRMSLAHASTGDDATALKYAARTKEMYDALNEWTDKYNKGILDGKWDHFFSWIPYHWYYSKGMDAPVATEELLKKVHSGPEACFVSVSDALSPEGASISATAEGDMPVWIHARTPVMNFSKARENNLFCKVSCGKDSFEAAATPINNIWHAPYVGPMWSRTGTVHLKEGTNTLYISNVKEDATIDAVYVGVYPPFPDAPLQKIPAASYAKVSASVTTVPGLGFSDGVMVLPFGTPSYEALEAPFAQYEFSLPEGKSSIEIITLPTLHVYEGRDARYCVSVDGAEPQVFSIHTDDFSSEWRWNVLRGYAVRRVDVVCYKASPHTLKIGFMDPGIVLQELRIY